MGYAMFAARKLMLTNSINMLNLELTKIMNQKMDLTELGSAISDGDISGADLAMCQQAGIAFETGIDLFTTKFEKLNDPEYYAGYVDASKQTREDLGISQIGLMFGTIFRTKKAKAYEKAMKEYKNSYEDNLKEEKIRDMQEQIALIEARLDQRQKTLETKIQAYTKDLESTEKAEAEGIKNSTPKYAVVQG